MKKSVSNAIKRHVTDSMSIRAVKGDRWNAEVKRLKRAYARIPHNRRAAWKERLTW